MELLAVFLATLLLAALIAYAGGAFVAADLNIAHWLLLERALTAFFWLFLGLPTGGALATIEADK